MRYFHRPQRAAAEALYLAAEHGKRFLPFGLLTVPDAAWLSASHVVLETVSGEVLAIAPETSGWAFLGPGEAQLFRLLMAGTRYRDLVAAWPGDEPSGALDFVAHLYRRGLVAIDGDHAVDQAMFADGPNYREGHLVELLVTEKCNLACKYCLAGANQAMPSMDATIARRTIDLAFAMRGHDTLAFEFAGGEPFLQFPLLRQLVDYIASHPDRRDRRLFLSVQTNATLLTAEKVQWLKDNDIRVGISIDGGAWAQNRSRPQVNGKPSHDRLLAGIRLLKDHGVAFGGLVVLNRSNIGSPAELVDIMLAEGINGFRLNPVAYLGDARRNWDTIGLEQAEVVAFFQSLVDLVITEQLPVLEDNVRSMLDFLTSQQRRTRCMRAQCGAGDTFQAVAGNGDIYPCGRATQSPGLKLGNVLDPDLHDLAAPARSHAVMAQLRARVPDDVAGCERCSYRQLCQSGCSAQAYERYGTVLHRTPECHFYKTMYPWLMHRLCFDPAGFSHLNAMHYLAGEGALFMHDFVAAAAVPAEYA